MKSYKAPRLVAVGSVVALTQGTFKGEADGNGTQEVHPAGSLGFNL
jgi:hypothetical protein